MEKNTGKVREKSGNFVSPEKWEPCMFAGRFVMASDMFRNQSVYSLATACSSQTLKYNRGKILLCNKTDQWLPVYDIQSKCVHV